MHVFEVAGEVEGYWVKVCYVTVACCGLLVKGLVMPQGARGEPGCEQGFHQVPACAPVCQALASPRPVSEPYKRPLASVPCRRVPDGARHVLGRLPCARRASQPPVSEPYSVASCKRALQEVPRWCVASTGLTADAALVPDQP